MLHQTIHIIVDLFFLLFFSVFTGYRLKRTFQTEIQPTALHKDLLQNFFQMLIFFPGDHSVGEYHAHGLFVLKGDLRIFEHAVDDFIITFQFQQNTWPVHLIKILHRILFRQIKVLNNMHSQLHTLKQLPLDQTLQLIDVLLGNPLGTVKIDTQKRMIRIDGYLSHRGNIHQIRQSCRKLQIRKYFRYLFFHITHSNALIPDTDYQGALPPAFCG